MACTPCVNRGGFEMVCLPTVSLNALIRHGTLTEQHRAQWRCYSRHNKPLERVKEAIRRLHEAAVDMQLPEDLFVGMGDRFVRGSKLSTVKRDEADACLREMCKRVQRVLWERALPEPVTEKDLADNVWMLEDEWSVGATKAETTQLRDAALRGLVVEQMMDERQLLELERQMADDVG